MDIKKNPEHEQPDRCLVLGCIILVSLFLNSTRSRRFRNNGNLTHECLTNNNCLLTVVPNITAHQCSA